MGMFVPPKKQLIRQLFMNLLSGDDDAGFDFFPPTKKAVMKSLMMKMLMGDGINFLVYIIIH